ncbi:hypothetical protein TSOC_002807 [Tetrabaena socialis]|uniref:Uncharacterized protein n=1 Tax=Tetrabaena socialis TaxID=47790 RepID=A0A2J8AD54_9CHLO|nr:hypothetical protein TSOC_002807 [Tetrabaena socialis]|eukprot:PNH10454.1 hypothetical protein TSOC_002807 [Tetrabaena socialis]
MSVTAPRNASFVHHKHAHPAIDALELAWSVGWNLSALPHEFRDSGFYGTLFRHPLAPKVTATGYYQLLLLSSADVEQRVILELADGGGWACL